MSVAGESKVGGIYRVLLDSSDQRRPRQETIVIVMRAAVVVVVGEIELRVVALEE